MAHKKMKSTIVIGLMLVSLSLAIIPSAQADIPVTIWGYVYVDDVLTDPDSVNLLIDGDTIPAELLGGAAYRINMDATNYLGDSGTFQVYASGIGYSALETITITGPGSYEKDLHVDTSGPGNHAPYEPNTPSPADGATGVTPSTDFVVQWNGGDPDTGDLVNYRLHWGTTSDPPFMGTIGSYANDESPISWTIQNFFTDYDTTYYWKIIAEDEHGGYNEGAVWSFTTGSETPSPPPPPPPPGGGGGGGGTPPPPSPPTADAGGPYFVYLIDGAAQVTFDGSGSSGATSYSWDFGTGDTGTGVSPTYTYTALGQYNVTLTVTNAGGSDEDWALVTVAEEANLPPTDPTLTGSQTGSVGIEYEYTATSTDGDNDTIQYIFDWGDDTNHTSDFVENGTTVAVNKSWDSYGFYTVSVKASDNKTESGASTIEVAIDVLRVKTIGYLIDSDSDGTYDLFYSNDAATELATEKQEDEYLINSDGEDGWEWVYDPLTDTLTEYSEPSTTPAEEDNTLLYVVAILVIIILVSLLYFFARKPAKKQPPKKQGKKKK